MAYILLDYLVYPIIYVPVNSAIHFIVSLHPCYEIYLRPYVEKYQALALLENQKL